MRNRLLPLLMLAAATAGASGVGTTGAEFLKIGVSARSLAMAGASAGVVDDVTSLYWNPAGLGLMGGRQVAASYSSLFKDESQGFLAYGAPLDGGVFAAGFDYLKISDIEKRAGDTETPDSLFSNQNWALSAAYARSIGEKKYAGATLKHIRTSLDTFKANTFAVDLGFRAGAAGDRTTLGASIHNLGPKLAEDPLPILLKAGVGYRPLSGLTLAADVDAWLNSERTYIDLGAEYRLIEALAVRGGYQIGRSKDKLGGGAGLAGGLGLSLGKMGLDYAFLPFGDLGSTHRVSLSYRF